MSDRWRVEPEPTEEELAALTAAIVAATVQVESEPAAPPVSVWRRVAKREAVEASAGEDARWGDRS